MSWGQKRRFYITHDSYLMKRIKIQKFKKGNLLPWNLLLLADPSKKIVKSYISNSDIYLALVEGKIVGEYVLTKLNENTVELKNIAVSKKFQGKGTGKFLVLDAIKKAEKSGFKTIEVGTGNSSFLQLALYQKCGFEIVGIIKNFFPKNYPEKIFENGIECKDMIRLSQDLLN